MSDSFFDLYERQEGLSLEIGHNQVADWCVEITDLTGKSLSNKGDPAVRIQEFSYELALAKAYVELCAYLSDARGGY